MTKAQLINELLNNTFVMLKPSTTHGIGVFAIKNIPKGCTTIFSAEPGEWIEITMDEFYALPKAINELVENYCLFDNDTYYLPAKGFKELDLALFLNHSDTPNIASVKDGAWFIALREIIEGEELFVDYGMIVSISPKGV